jgi:hypothetical protein
MIVTPAYIVPRHDLSLIEIDHLYQSPLMQTHGGDSRIG